MQYDQYAASIMQAIASYANSEVHGLLAEPMLDLLEEVYETTDTTLSGVLLRDGDDLLVYSAAITGKADSGGAIEILGCTVQLCWRGYWLCTYSNYDFQGGVHLDDVLDFKENYNATLVSRSDFGTGGMSDGETRFRKMLMTAKLADHDIFKLVSVV